MQTIFYLLGALFQGVPDLLRKEFHSSLLWLNLLRIRVMGWIMLVALVVFSYLDYSHFSTIDTDQGWTTFKVIVSMRALIVIFTTGVLYLLGFKLPQSSLKPLHQHLNVLFSFIYLMYVGIIMAYMFSFRHDLSGYLFFILIASGFLSYGPILNLVMLFFAFGTLQLGMLFMEYPFETYKYQVITALLMTILCYGLSRLIYAKRVDDFMSQKLIERQNVELDRARVAADEANRAKSDFLASMSHEIRTPMNSILGMTEITLETDLTDEQQDYLTTVMDASQQLLSIIDDILDFSKIEAGKMTLEEVDFELGQTLSSAVRTMQPIAEDKGLVMLVELDPGVPVFLKGDPVRIRQILLNLLSNSIKFTDAGAVKVRAYSAGPAPDGKRVLLRLAVSDTGIGIAQEKQQMIFDGFSQADGSTTRKYGGTGLGLTICRRLARLMGGTLTLSSSIGQGSTFTLSLPLGVGDVREVSSPQNKTDTNNDALRILVVDDNSVNLKVARAQLAKLGHKTLPAQSGPEAIMLMEAEEVDLVLMDIEMPGMDGVETTEILRRGGPSGDWSELRSGVPVIAMTAHAMGTVRTRALSAGMTDFLTKPVNFQRLRAALTNLKARGPRTRTPEPPPALSDETILDRNGARDHLGVDQEGYDAIFDAAFRELEPRCEEAGVALVQGDLNRVADLAHNVKSSTRTIGAMALSKAARQLESTARQGLRDDAGKDYAHLVDQLRSLLSVVKS